MSLVTFLEERLLPNDIEFGFSGGPTFDTQLVPTLSGNEWRAPKWSQQRQQYQMGLVVRRAPQFIAIRNAFMAAQGRAVGFRFWDQADYQVATAESAIQASNGSSLLGSVGVGYGVPSYQLRKVYATVTGAYTRDIKKPVAGTLVLKRGVATVTAGVLAGNYGIDNTQGLVTFVADQSKNISTHTVGASHQVALASAFAPNVAVAGRVYFLGISGTLGTALNGLSFPVSAVSGANLTFTVNTTGLTGSGGTAYLYPQPTDALTFTVNFDVPVRFDTDTFSGVVVNRSGPDLLISLPNCPLIEIRI